MVMDEGVLEVIVWRAWSTVPFDITGDATSAIS
jgi:hypothetical protein